MCTKMYTKGLLFVDLILISTLLVKRTSTDSSFAMPDDDSSSLTSTPLSTRINAVTENNINSTLLNKSDIDCSAKLPISDYNFRYKYTTEQFQQWMCQCRNVCKKINVNPAVKEEVHKLAYRNKERIASVISVFTILLVIGILGNVMTIIGLVRWMKKSSPTFAFIISLSISDLLLLCVCMPLKVSEYFYFSDVFTEWTCKLSYYIRDFTLVCSVLTLTVISSERYYAICHPLVVQYRCTLVRARIIITVTWFISLCLATPSIFMAKFYKPLGMIYRTCLPQSTSVHYLRLYFIYYMGVLFVLPTVVMVIAYGRSCYTLWKSTRVSKQLQGTRYILTQGNHVKTRHAENDDQSRRQVIKILILIAVVFLLCWGPPLIVQLLVVMGTIDRNREEVRLGVETLTYISSTLNPYLFMAMSSQFRQAALRCIRYRRDPSYHEASTLMPTVTSSAMDTSLDNNV